MPLTKADIEKMPFTLNAKQVAEILGVILYNKS